jgi:hypothetical protein
VFLTPSPPQQAEREGPFLPRLMKAPDAVLSPKGEREVDLTYLFTLWRLFRPEIGGFQR